MARKVLIIDDTILVRAMAEAALAPEGYDVLGATCGADGREQWRLWRPDVVFLDLTMPDESGWEVLEAMRATPEGARTPVFILSGEDDPAVAADATARGAQGFIHKPFTNSELLDALSSLSPAS
jgi:CheY-like chemotaxis protein